MVRQTRGRTEAGGLSRQPERRDWIAGALHAIERLRRRNFDVDAGCRPGAMLVARINDFSRTGLNRWDSQTQQLPV